MLYNGVTSDAFQIVAPTSVVEDNGRGWKKWIFIQNNASLWIALLWLNYSKIEIEI